VKECQLQGLTLSDELFDDIVHKIQDEKRLDLAAFQPRFILDQVVASCRFMQQAVGLEPRFLNYAIDNLRVHHEEGPKGAVQVVQKSAEVTIIQ
jgi:hypothetical protein